jgi:hypothetical protein
MKRIAICGVRSSEGPHSRRTVNMVVSPVGLGIKNDCVSEDQQQFSSQS